MRTISTNIISLAVVLVLSATGVLAQTFTDNSGASITTEQAQEFIDSAYAQGLASRVAVQDLLKNARENKDTLKINCILDTLHTINERVDTVSVQRKVFTDSVKKAEWVRAQEQVTKVSGVLQSITTAEESANGCVTNHDLFNSSDTTETNPDSIETYSYRLPDFIAERLSIETVTTVEKRVGVVVDFLDGIWKKILQLPLFRLFR